MLANIRPNIRHILGISLLPLFYPYGRYLALFYIYRLDPILAYIRHSHSSVFIAQGIITGGGHDTAQPRTTPWYDATTHNPFSHQYVRWQPPSRSQNPRDLGMSSRPCMRFDLRTQDSRQEQTGSSRNHFWYYFRLRTAFKELKLLVTILSYLIVFKFILLVIQ